MKETNLKKKIEFYFKRRGFWYQRDAFGEVGAADIKLYKRPWLIGLELKNRPTLQAALLNFSKIQRYQALKILQAGGKVFLFNHSKKDNIYSLVLWKLIPGVHDIQANSIKRFYKLESIFETMKLKYE